MLLFVSGPAAFWIFGLVLTLFVGPAQSSSRTFLARLAPAGQEGQLFGLYATTGRAVSFLAPTLVGLCTQLFGVASGPASSGILLVLGLGLLALWPVRPPATRASPPACVTPAQRAGEQPHDASRDISHSWQTRHNDVCKAAGMGDTRRSGRRTSGVCRVAMTPGRGPFLRREQAAAVQTLHPMVSAEGGSLGQ